MRRILTSSSTAPDVTRNYTGRSRRRSSARMLMYAAAIIALAGAASTVHAQEPTPPSIDSLAARLERAEETIALLKQQLADQAQSGVQTRSRMSFELHGRVLLNAFSNSAQPNMVDVPLFVLPRVADGLPRGGVGLTVRQTSLGFAVTAPNILGADFSGDMDVDFFGGQYDGVTTPLLRLAVARGWLRWKSASVMVGQDVPLISPLNPLSLAAVGAPGFSTSGNLWAWLPQVRAGIERPGRVTLGLQGAVLSPTASGSANMSASDHDLAQRSKRPFVEARAHARWGAEDLAGEVGFGTHAGWYATANSTRLRRSAGVAADALVPFSRKLELRGEWYAGDAMQGLGGGAIGQLFDAKDQPIHCTGMWSQVNYKPSSHLTLGAGFGVDDPDDRGMTANARLKNVVTELHLHVRPAGPVVLGLEFRRMATTYATGRFENDHLNLAAGFVF